MLFQAIKLSKSESNHLVGVGFFCVFCVPWILYLPLTYSHPTRCLAHQVGRRWATHRASKSLALSK
jgi:hypothetical protein